MPKEIDPKILQYLAKEDWPVTTETVAKELKISWNTAQIHLYKLQAEGLVKGKRVGRQNQWMLSKKGEKAIG
ncbi:MAG: FaeA/PapI family transcriptional regulator [Methanocellales archaeon]|nr:FaeA/PapI family transcriptional regulator [Methanocellales archaeon]MDD3292115.1 FaeA/PapI family transcriptional regulator [Methanocellales archaeon]MDD5235352.1 FaeA/PapI family transcriptional regulator [Methanocellales archaeon]MDD5485700.1 FaeA/PapI family transcriptional regulator [Methanocellales archaeon]